MNLFLFLDGPAEQGHEQTTWGRWHLRRQEGGDLREGVGWDGVDCGGCVFLGKLNFCISMN